MKPLAEFIRAFSGFFFFYALPIMVVGFAIIFFYILLTQNL